MHRHPTPRGTPRRVAPPTARGVSHLFLLALVACGASNLEEQTARDLVGRWQLQDPTLHSVQSFHDDGTYEVTIEDKAIYGRWRIEMNDGHGVLWTCGEGAECDGGGVWVKHAFTLAQDSLLTGVDETFGDSWRRVSPKP